MVPDLDEPLLAPLAAALSGLVAYVDGRTSAVTEDDDVRALEDVSATLSALSEADQRRLRELLPPSIADGLGLSE